MTALRWLQGVAMAGAAFFGSLSGDAAIAQKGPAGDAFYVPPVSMSAAEHGSVIWTRSLTNSAALPDAGRNVIVLYHSQDFQGRDVAVSGTLAIPAGTAPKDGWPLITWTHGTTGLVPACAPSRDTEKGPEHHFLSMKQAMLNDYVKRGYAVAATDYEGLGGTPRLHPFLQGLSEAHAALDIIRAAKQIEPPIGTRYVVIGHSQGGQADLFAAAIGPQYVPEFELLGNVAFAPASHIAATMQSMIAATKPSLRLGYTMYVLQSFASNHADVDLTKILSPQARAHLPETRLACISETLSKGYWATAIPKEQFQAGADLSAVLKIAAENDPATLNVKVPTFVAQGTADETVLPAWTDEVVHSLCKKGAELLYAVYPGADHESVVRQAGNPALTWIAGRFAGSPGDSNCLAQPSAGRQ